MFKKLCLERREMSKNSSKTNKSKAVESIGVLPNFLAQLRLSEVQAGLFLGIAVIFSLFVITLSINEIKSAITSLRTDTKQGFIQPQTPVIDSDRQVLKTTSNQAVRTYIVAKGDNLWNISQQVYKSGYNWVDIAKANNLKNPGLLYVGMELNIPSVPKIAVESRSSTLSSSDILQDKLITGSSYTVSKGDNLWNISVRAYSDGFRWVEIARENNLNNPSLIFQGNVLKIPK
jgi:nucleoid-associated protein YgaU